MRIGQSAIHPRTILIRLGLISCTLLIVQRAMSGSDDSFEMVVGVPKAKSSSESDFIVAAPSRGVPAPVPSESCSDSDEEFMFADITIIPPDRLYEPKPADALPPQKAHCSASTKF